MYDMELPSDTRQRKDTPYRPRSSGERVWDRLKRS